MLRPIFCIDINTRSERKWKTMQIFFNKLFFQNISFYWSFYRYCYHCYFIYSDWMWRHKCTTCNSIIFISSTEKKKFCKVCRPWFLLEKISAFFTLKSNFGYKKPISYCILFETNKYIYRNGNLLGC